MKELIKHFLLLLISGLILAACVGIIALDVIRHQNTPMQKLVQIEKNVSISQMVPEMGNIGVAIVKEKIDNPIGFSFIEITQEILLGLTALIFFLLSKRQPENKQIFIMASAFFTCLLIRELDEIFDIILWHGSWIVFIIPTLIALGIFLKNSVYDLNLNTQTKNFTSYSSYSMLFSGLIITLFFSRLFGKGDLWKLIIINSPTQYYFIKTITEESLELLGYCLIFMASMQMLFSSKKNKYIC